MYGQGNITSLVSSLQTARMYMEGTNVEAGNVEAQIHAMIAAKGILPGLAKIAGLSTEEIAWITELASRPPMLPVKGEHTGAA